MIEKDIPGFPGLVLAFSGIEHGPMPKANGTSPKKLANRDGFVSSLGFDAGRICQAKLVHGDEVAFVSDPEKIIEQMKERFKSSTAREVEMTAKNEPPYKMVKSGEIIPYHLAFYRNSFDEMSLGNEDLST